jgi:hypothetical protein
MTVVDAPRASAEARTEITITPLGHAVFLGLLVLPLAAAPGIALARRLRAMDATLRTMSTALAETRAELRTAVREAALRREEYALLARRMHGVHADFGHVRARVGRLRDALGAAAAREQAGARELRCAPRGCGDGCGR